MSDKARIAAYNAVKRIFAGAYSNLIPTENGLEGLDRAFAESIAMGTLERKITLEYILNDFLKKDTKADMTALIMTGAYQILFMDRVPDSAACDETVNIAKQFFGKNASGFVNAVLRNICRNKAEIEKKLESADGYIKYSVNKDLFELIKEQYPEQFEEIFASFFGKQELHLRVNTLKANADEVAQAVEGAKLNEGCVVTDNAKSALSLIDEGKFYVQGLASQRAVELLGAQPNETVIDVCACPGGKSLGAAIDMKNSGRVFSFDLHANKLPLIEKSANKLGITIIKTEKRDAKCPDESLFGTADRVICDVPCSGTGVMGSKPEIKYKSPDAFKGLYDTQKAIIAASAKYLKRGGTMVYSTCSINKKENEDVVNGFLDCNNGFSLCEMTTYLPFGEAKEGFFTAKIKREI
ncbi:MAG: 16S rRNA (cytosine(967)-C(5))-methyltransferase RsmB [Clostridia bacterium]|nr:16S rRNA (cytosine(967)-C(5))-methyltransferase RsmB [Clostridia bacterium]